MSTSARPVKICSVNYLNAVPLTWGMVHGPQRDHVELTFAIPSICADRAVARDVELGLVPIANIARQHLEVVTGYGIACRGAVRSILLVSRKPPREIQSLATDLSSRTSVELARVILRELYGAEPVLHPEAPVLDTMLAESDAALLIGDPALRLDPYELPYQVLDLGAEWYALTGLPMVFALWAGQGVGAQENLSRLLESSYRFGESNMRTIVDTEWCKRGVTRELAHEYLTRYIRYEIGDEEWQGAEAFLELAGLPRVSVAVAEAR